MKRNTVDTVTMVITAANLGVTVGHLFGVLHSRWWYAVVVALLVWTPYSFWHARHRA